MASEKPSRQSSEIELKLAEVSCDQTTISSMEDIINNINVRRSAGVPASTSPDVTLQNPSKGFLAIYSRKKHGSGRHRRKAITPQTVDLDWNLGPRSIPRATWPLSRDAHLPQPGSASRTGTFQKLISSAQNDVSETLGPYLPKEITLYPRTQPEARTATLAATPLVTPSLEIDDPMASFSKCDTAAEDCDEDDTQQEPPNFESQVDSSTSTPVLAAKCDKNTYNSIPHLLSGEAALKIEDDSTLSSKRQQQWAFPKLRDPELIIAELKDFKDMPTNALYSALAKVNKSMILMQEEYAMLKKVTDDEDNAVRRRAHDVAYENQLARENGKAFPKAVVERDFAVKGVRARQHTYKDEKVYMRNQDRIQAQAHGFVYDDRESMIGLQDPIGQRDGLLNKRLRNRPKLSKRAVEAASEVPQHIDILTGKRTRKQRILADESRDVSRSGTPADIPRKPGRPRKNLDFSGVIEEDEGADVRGSEPPTHVLDQTETLPRRRTRQTKTTTGPAEPVVPLANKRPIRESRRGTLQQVELHKLKDQSPTSQAIDIDGATSEPPNETHASLLADAVAQIHREQDDTNTPVPRPNSTARHDWKKSAEISAASFYGPKAVAHQPAEDQDHYDVSSDHSRPTTSSSMHSTGTIESSYSFRKGKRKNYNDLANPPLPAIEKAEPKRVRHIKQQQFEDSPMSAAPESSHILAPAPIHADGRDINNIVHNMNNSNNIPFVNMNKQHIYLPPIHHHHPAAAVPFPGPEDQVLSLIDPSMRSKSKPLPRSKANSRKPRIESLVASVPGLSSFHVERMASQPPESPFNLFRPASVPIATADALAPPPVRGPKTNESSRATSANADTSGGTSPGGQLTPSSSLMNAEDGEGGVMMMAGGGSGGMGGGGGGDERSYHTMTKAEKMSHSMKARWKNGSMQQAVTKRKETLARKKQRQQEEKAARRPTPPPSDVAIPYPQYLPPMLPVASGFHHHGGFGAVVNAGERQEEMVNAVCESG